MARKWDTHPNWLKQSRIPLTIVCGPPCGGKTTYVKQHAVPGDTVIDLDQIRRKLRPGFKPWSSSAQDEKLLQRAIRVRNMMLAQLAIEPKKVSVPHHSTSAWFIVSAPTQKEREWWRDKLGGKVVLINPGFQECKRRAYAQGTPLAADGVDAWEAKSEKNWNLPVQRHAISFSGWPIEDEADIELRKALSL